MCCLKRCGRRAHEQKSLAKHGSAIRVFGHAGLRKCRPHHPADSVARCRNVSYSRHAPCAAGHERRSQNAGRAGTGNGGSWHSARSAGLQRESQIFKQLNSHLVGSADLRDFPNLDDAIEWAEDQVIFRYGGFSNLVEVTLGEQELLAGLSHDEIAELAKNCETRIYRPGERIIARQDPSDSVFFLEQGMVSVKLADGVRLATLVPGMAFGELALIAFGRTADVWADNAVRCQRISLDVFDEFRNRYPATAERIIRNLAQLLAQRLSQANTKIGLLSAN